MTHPLAALLKDVPHMASDGKGNYLVRLSDILAALEAAPVPDLVEAGKVLEQWTAYVESMGSVMGEAEHIAQQMHDTIRALIALATAQAAQIAGLTKELSSGSFYKEADIDALMNRAEAAEAKVARLVEALTNLPAVYAHQINTGVREVYDPLQRFYTMESVLTAINEAQK